MASLRRAHAGSCRQADTCHGRPVARDPMAVDRSAPADPWHVTKRRRAPPPLRATTTRPSARSPVAQHHHAARAATRARYCCNEADQLLQIGGGRLQRHHARRMRHSLLPTSSRLRVSQTRAIACQGQLAAQRHRPLAGRLTDDQSCPWHDTATPSWRPSTCRRHPSNDRSIVPAATPP